MTTVTKPDVRPARPEFSSGPCAKRPGWTPFALADAALGQAGVHLQRAQTGVQGYVGPVGHRSFF